MNASKLLNILLNISKEEKEFGISIKLEELFNFIKQNNIEQSDLKKTEVYNFFENSIINNYTKSNLSIIEELSGVDYLGLGAKKFLENIFSSENYKLLSRLDEYKKNRVNFIQKIQNLIKNLEDFNFNPHSYKEEYYEVGLILPHEFKELNGVYGALKDWDGFLGVISEISGEERKNEISLIDNGSWDFFVLKGMAVARVLDIILNEIADLYLKIQQIQKNKEELKFLKNKTIEHELKNEEQKIYNNFLEDILKETFKLYKGDEGRKNELKTELKSSLKRVLKLTEFGASMEIIIPEISIPVEPQEKNEENLKEYERLKVNYDGKIEDIKKIKDTNKKIIKLGNNSTSLLLTSGLLDIEGGDVIEGEK